MSEQDQSLPWPLQRVPFLVIAFAFAPLAYLIVLLGWKRLDRETRGDRFFVASVLLIIFSIGFMPEGILRIALAFGVFGFLIAATFAVMKRRE